MKKKTNDLNRSEIITNEFERLQKVYFAGDLKKLKEIKDEISEKFQKYKKEYEPWSEKTSEFNSKAEAYFKEDEEVMAKRKSSHNIAETQNVLKALHAVSVIMLIFYIVITFVSQLTRGWAHYSWVILGFTWLVIIARGAFDLWYDSPLIFKRKHKWPKGFDHKGQTNAFILYDAYCSADTIGVLFDRFVFCDQLMKSLEALDQYPEALKALNQKFKEIKDKGEFN